MTPQRLTIIIEKEDNWYIGWIEEVPGTNTQGGNLDEVWANLKEAMQRILEANSYTITLSPGATETQIEQEVSKALDRLLGTE